MAVKDSTLSTKISNPFDGRDSNEVWEELKKNAKPVDKQELLETLEKLKKNRKS